MRAPSLFQRGLLWNASLVWLVGCDFLTGSEQSPATPSADWEASTNLTGEYGGYEYTDEQPAFGDPAVAKIDAEESMVPVEPAAVPPGAFALRVLWGQLRGNRDNTQVTDWSGQIAVSSGGVGVLHTIAFEPPGDHLLPRENRQVLGFVSHTQPSFDGLLLIVAAGDDPAATFSFRTAPYSNTWTMRELRSISTVIPVDDLGNAVAVEAISLDPACPNGYVRGHWVRRTAEERGVFRGVWATALGMPLGHIRGHFGINAEGQHVWFGKIIDREGRVLGLARGMWAPNDDPAMPGGNFAGHWVARGGERQGDVGGHYLPTRETDVGIAGFFAGRWNTDCGEPVNPVLP